MLRQVLRRVEARHQVRWLGRIFDYQRGRLPSAALHCEVIEEEIERQQIVAPQHRDCEIGERQARLARARNDSPTRSCTSSLDDRQNAEGERHWPRRHHLPAQSERRHRFEQPRLAPDRGFKSIQRIGFETRLSDVGVAHLQREPVGGHPAPRAAEPRAERRLIALGVIGGGIEGDRVGRPHQQQGERMGVQIGNSACQPQPQPVFSCRGRNQHPRRVPRRALSRFDIDPVEKPVRRNQSADREVQHRRLQMPDRSVRR